MEDDAPPSKVLHLRNFTPEITQHDLESLVSRYGEIVHVVLMRAKNQALVQFKDLQSAIAMRSYYPSGYVQINGRKVYIKYSRHQELTNNQTLNRVLLSTFHNPYTHQINAYINMHGNDPGVNKQQLMQMQLMAAQYDNLITSDWVYHLFSAYGTVEKIVILHRNVGVQALIQFSTVEAATAAKQYLQSQSVYAADSPIYYVLDVQFSNLADVKIHRSGPKSRDYTAVQFPPHLPIPSQHHPHHHHHHHQQQQQHPAGLPQQISPAAAPYGYSAFPYPHGGFPSMPIGQPQSQHHQYPYPHNGFPGGVAAPVANGAVANNNARQAPNSAPTTGSSAPAAVNDAPRKTWQTSMSSSAT